MKLLSFLVLVSTLLLASCDQPSPSKLALSDAADFVRRRGRL